MPPILYALNESQNLMPMRLEVNGRRSAHVKKVSSYAELARKTANTDAYACVVYIYIDINTYNVHAWRPTLERFHAVLALVLVNRGSCVRVYISIHKSNGVNEVESMDFTSYY
jgi:hypothetical protein